MKTGLNTALDPTRRSHDAQDFDNALRRKIVGQDAAIEKVTEIYQMFLAGLNPPNRPIGNLLFLGPTGSGKSIKRTISHSSSYLAWLIPSLSHKREKRNGIRLTVASPSIVR